MSQLTATYRLQMNAGFTLSHARARVEYFARLGVSHLYCSPCSPRGRAACTATTFRSDAHQRGARNRGRSSRPGAGSSREEHGDHPRHRSEPHGNRRRESVLGRRAHHGERSRYARWFDIDWSANPAERRRLILPILGDELDRVLERGEMAVRLQWGGTPRIVYFDHSFPIDPSTLPPELQLAQADPEETGELARLYSGAAGRDRLRDLLAAQRYELVSFRRASSDVNYRASSTSPTWLVSASKTRRYSPRRTRSSCVSCASVSSTDCASITSTGSAIRWDTSRASVPRSPPTRRSSSRKSSRRANPCDLRGPCRERPAMNFSTTWRMFRRSVRFCRDRARLSSMAQA